MGKLIIPMFILAIALVKIQLGIMLMLIYLITWSSGKVSITRKEVGELFLPFLGLIFKALKSFAGLSKRSFSKLGSSLKLLLTPK